MQRLPILFSTGSDEEHNPDQVIFLTTDLLYEAISKLGFWSKVKAEPSFPALRDSPPDRYFIVGHSPQAH
jgi:hypothetical protein